MLEFLKSIPAIISLVKELLDLAKKIFKKDKAAGIKEARDAVRLAKEKKDPKAIQRLLSKL